MSDKPTGRLQLNGRERALVKILAENPAITMSAAMLQAGYSPSTSAKKQKKLHELGIGSSINDEYERMGLSDAKIIETLVAGLDAHRAVVIKSVIKDYPDWVSRLRAVEISLKIKDKFPTERHTIQGVAGAPPVQLNVNFAGGGSDGGKV